MKKLGCWRLYKSEQNQGKQELRPWEGCVANNLFMAATLGDTNVMMMKTELELVSEVSCSPH